MTAAPRDEYDVIVIGSGVAGMATAVGLSGLRRVALVTSGALRSGSTAWAQGGLAAAIGEDDSASLHALDTITAGASFGDGDAIRVLTDSAPGGLAQLLRLGADLDREPDGRLALTREGGHSRRRVVHAGGDASGAETSRTLANAIQHSDIDVIEHATVRDLLTTNTGSRSITGVVLNDQDGTERRIATRAVVLATGGVGGLFATTTNPPEVSGAGLGLALRAGASLVDLEFIQFHPTALDVGTASGQVPLMTEALRGEGAVLRDQRGRAIMAGRHPLADLAPRDVVARRVDEVRATDEVRLDATAIPDLSARFPTIVAACRARGIDPTRDPIPVAPTQHFLCGGVRTDEWGASDVMGLYAVGEVAATGVHGANRLASNSLIEGLVFGARVASRLALDLPPQPGVESAVITPRPRVPTDSLPELRRVMSSSAGIRRTGAALSKAGATLAAMPLASSSQLAVDSIGDEWLAATAILAAAAERGESRGCHWRADHPASSEWWRQRRVVVRLDDDGVPVATTEPAVREESELERTA